MPAEQKPNTFFLRPFFVYFGFFWLVAVHIIAALFNTPASLQLIINSISCVYIGSMANSKIRFNKETKKLEKQELEEDSEQMTKKDAAMLPIYLSGYLFGIYVLFKFLDKAILQALITGFFSLVGVLCLMEVIEDTIGKFFPPKFSQEYIIQKHLKFNFIFMIKEVTMKLTKLNFISFAISLFPISYYLLTRNWLCNNLFGIAFSIAGIANFTVLPNFKVGFVMLWGLFFYDIFWVYGTDVMVTVAKSIDAPIKLMFPYNWSEEPPLFSMLGLGDIVIPGVFVSLCLKYDLDRQINNVKKISEIDIGYFNWCFAGYTLGIITTFVVMVVFNHPQPALLFLVPGCTGSAILKALKDKKLKEFWGYEQEDPKKKLPAPEEVQKNE